MIEELRAALAAAFRVVTGDVVFFGLVVVVGSLCAGFGAVWADRWFIDAERRRIPDETITADRQRARRMGYLR